MSGLKEKLREIEKNDYALMDSQDVFLLVKEMLTEIGSPDPELRDNLIYSTFVEWFNSKSVFSHQQLEYILNTALDDRHLFLGIGENGTDSVFTRSFSALLFPLLLSAHREEPFISQTDMLRVKALLLKYYQEEKDIRGFVPGKGWAHTAAHGADALDDLALCREIDSTGLLDVLHALAEKICSPDLALNYEEDERITTAVMSVLSRGLLPENDIKDWIKDLSNRAMQIHREPANFCYRNVKNFLRSLYFRMDMKDVYPEYKALINQVLTEISHYNF